MFVGSVRLENRCMCVRVALWLHVCTCRHNRHVETHLYNIHILVHETHCGPPNICIYMYVYAHPRTYTYTHTRYINTHSPDIYVYVLMYMYKRHRQIETRPSKMYVYVHSTCMYIYETRPKKYMHMNFLEPLVSNRTLSFL